MSQSVSWELPSSAEPGWLARWSAELRKRPLLAVGVALLFVYLVLAVVGPAVTVDPLRTNPANQLLPPSAAHPFGTDEFGRDVFARAVAAARLDLWIGLVIAVVSMVVGSVIGVVAGYWGGRVDEVIMRLTDVLLAFPGFVLALILVAAMGDSVPNVIVAVSVSFLPHFIRLTRAEALQQREMEYVDGARLAGNPPWRVGRQASAVRVLHLPLVEGFGTC